MRSVEWPFGTSEMIFHDLPSSVERQMFLLTWSWYRTICGEVESQLSGLALGDCRR